jgi:hypothetical protein
LLASVDMLLLLPSSHCGFPHCSPLHNTFFVSLLAHLFDQSNGLRLDQGHKSGHSICVSKADKMHHSVYYVLTFVMVITPSIELVCGSVE